MAQKIDKEGSVRKFQQIMDNIRAKKFAGIYVNLSVVYGNETDAGQIVCLCRRYPVASPYQLIIVKEAQQLSSLQPFEYYLKVPAPDTILVLSFTGKNLDKRTGFYKSLKDKAEVLESYPLDEWKVPQWITNHVQEKGYSIEPDAAQLLA